MQLSPNDVYRTPVQNEAPANKPAERGRFDVLEQAREDRANEARADLERYYFAKAALGSDAKAHTAQTVMPEAGLEQLAVNLHEILPYVKRLGDFINYEREEVVKNGWSA